ncbi:DUF1302 domain-containing protein [Endozoicomonas lisbonensis]|uniref:DUF1302 domain-containing protein n=2 Tax=Endozoicomonas lisbonensis TaxID=3120522 RepID=A0ABV2SNR0_9GAMM
MMPGRTPALRIAPVQAGFSLAGLLLAFPSYSLEFSDESGSMTGALDTTLSYGTLWRVQGQDLKHYKGSSTADHDDVNTNDGNRAYDTGVVSQVFRISADLEVDWEDQYGLFIRGTAFYDTRMMDRHNYWLDANRGRSPDQTDTYPYGDDWSEDVLDGQGHDAKIQDAYIYGAWDIGDMPLDVRFGKQVINWGEGIFYRDGINTVNALDGASFALPGSEVKDLLIPQHALSFRLGVTDNLSMAAYYQFEWENSVTPGRGTFFSTNDLFTDGGTKGYNEAPALFEQVRRGWNASAGGALGDFYDITGVNVHSGYLVVADTSGEKDASDNGQWGINFKYYAEELNDTEFGFYFVNYNSHTPYIEAHLSDNAGSDALSAVTGGNNPTLQAALDQYYSGIEASGLASKTAVIQSLATAHVLSNSVYATRVYPEDIQMYGLSFNTAIGRSSIAGELAYRPNAPIWIDHPDDLIDGVKDNIRNILSGSDCFAGNLSQAYPDQGYCQSSGAYKNFKEVKLWTGSLAIVHNFGPSLGFDGLYGIVEPAFELIQGLDDYDRHVSSASGPWGGGFDDDYHPASDRLDKFSWGYTAVLSGEWHDFIAGINLNPVLTFKHDVSGNSRLTGNFLEGRKAVTMALRGVYLNTVEAGLAYTSFFGSKRTNKLHDRDNVAFSVKYSF